MAKTTRLLVPVILLTMIGVHYHVETIHRLVIEGNRLKEDNGQLRKTCRQVKVEYEVLALTDNAKRSVDGYTPKPMIQFAC